MATLPADVLADAAAIVADWGENVSFDGGAAVLGIVTDLSLSPDRPGAQALGIGARGQARRVKLELVSTGITPGVGQKVTIASIAGVTFKVESFLRRLWITEVDLVAVEAI